MDRGPILDYTEALRGNLYIVSAPSGSGKTTLLDQLMTRFDDLIFSVSFTTRKPRGQERHGVEYFFVNAADFLDMAERNEFLEWAEVHGNYYGTGRKFVEDNLNAGRSVILDIDVQGKSLVQEKMPDAVTIFLMPPSYAELARRLRSRELEDDETIRLRLAIAKKEIQRYRDYDYIVVNDDIGRSLAELEAVIRAAAVRPTSQQDRIESIIESFGGTDC
jgi:guanylate kinase